MQELINVIQLWMPEEVFLNTSFEEKNDIYVREVIKLS